MTFFDMPTGYGPQPSPSTVGEHRTAGPGDEPSDWDEWEDEGAVTPIEDSEQLIPSTSPSHVKRQSKKSSTPKPQPSTPRYSVHKPQRLKSRQRQKAQNAKAGIKLITDLPPNRKPAKPREVPTQNAHGPKFVDLAALRALEGNPNPSSVGTWNWLKRQKTAASPQAPIQTPLEDHLSPADRPIVIGISMDPEAAQERIISPETAVVKTPLEFPLLHVPVNTHLAPPQASPNHLSPGTPTQFKSVWSPDTPSTATTFNSSRAPSSIYSQILNSYANRGGSFVPPVPAVPQTYNKDPGQNLASIGSDDDYLDTGTPYTPFEEDGKPSPRRSQVVARQPSLSRTVLGHRSRAVSEVLTEWEEDDLNTPTLTATVPGTAVPSRTQNSPCDLGSQSEWWAGTDEKSHLDFASSSQLQQRDPSPTPPSLPVTTRHSPSPSPPFIRAPSTRSTPSPRPLGSATMSSSTSRPNIEHNATMQNKTPRMDHETPIDRPPPPYESATAQDPRPQQPGRQVAYRAFYPPDHPSHEGSPPSPETVPPAMVSSMASGGAHHLTDIPLTPNPYSSPYANSNDRPQGTFVPQEHSVPAHGPRFKTEMQRRRHEKEDFHAKRLGSLWRGRGCCPMFGWCGRTGREGRKKRRVCLIILAAVVILVALAIALPVVLRKGSLAVPASDSTATTDNLPVSEVKFVNLTDFPAMPTGLMTVVGADLKQQFTGCTPLSTTWSCSLPREQQDAVKPYNHDQPTVVLKIEYDDDPARYWDIPNGDPPAGRVEKRRLAEGIIPQPAPPSFEEMWFLGNTTDGIVSDDKAGEPTPFYMSILPSLDADIEKLSITPDKGSFKEILATLERTSDGKPVVRLLPEARQQPVRLYDRGLETEHYGIYTHFRRTMYTKAITPEHKTRDDSPGGCKEEDALWYVARSETRFLIQIWTDPNAATLLRKGNQDGIKDTPVLTRPGTMPYAVTMKLDSHGGHRNLTGSWAWPIDEEGRVDTLDKKAVENHRDAGGELINPDKTGDPALGGFNGGTGGCKCEWANFAENVN